MTDSVKKVWYKRWWVIAIFIFFILGLFSMLGDDSPEKSVSITNENPKVEEKTTVIEEQTTVVFDLETLYGKNIDEIRIILGEPSDGDYTEPNQKQLELGTTEWTNTFKKDEYGLLVTYNVESRDVIDFFMSTDDPSGATKNTEKIEKLLNVKDSQNFTIEPVKALTDSSVYTGIKATPKK